MTFRRIHILTSFQSGEPFVGFLGGHMQTIGLILMPGRKSIVTSFLAFFLAFYAVLTWGLIFTARQSLQVAAEEGARASLRYQAAGTTVLPQIQARLATACSLVDRASNWVGSLSGQATECKATVAGAGVCGGTGACCREFERNVPAGAGTCQAPTSGWTVMVRVVYPNYGARPLLPVFPGFGALLPSQLSAQAEIWIPPTSLDRGI